jgi:hypothetical protein
MRHAVAKSLHYRPAPVLAQQRQSRKATSLQCRVGGWRDADLDHWPDMARSLAGRQSCDVARIIAQRLA